jgi:hypothetical protein
MSPVRVVFPLLSLRLQEGDASLFLSRPRLLQRVRDICASVGQAIMMVRRDLMSMLDLRGQMRVLDRNRAGAFGVLLCRPDVISSALSRLRHPFSRRCTS